MDDSTVMRARKIQHLEVCTTKNVEYERTTTLFEDVTLIHCAMPELSEADVDLRTTFMGRELAAPLMISAMTGGVDRARTINRELAAVAHQLGIGFGLGSQRPMVRDPGQSDSFRVRDVAPNALIVGNLGIQQARELPDEVIAQLISSVDLDGLALHLNPGMELFQPEGDRDFRGGYETVERLAKSFPGRIIVKETGCGISRDVAARLRAKGIQYLDVAGAGGTSWIRVELYRSQQEVETTTSPFVEWGIPTAASLGEVAPFGFKVIASGGIRTGLDVAKALALKANLVGIALPIIRVYEHGGAEAVLAYLRRVIAELKCAMILTGSPTIEALRQHRPHIGTNLLTWMQRYENRGFSND